MILRCWSSQQAQHIQSMKLIWRPLDLILLLLLMAAMVFTILRGLVRCDVYYIIIYFKSNTI